MLVFPQTTCSMNAETISGLDSVSAQELVSSNPKYRKEGRKEGQKAGRAEKGRVKREEWAPEAKREGKTQDGRIEYNKYNAAVILAFFG